MVQSVKEDRAPYPNTAEELAKFWVDDFDANDNNGVVLTGQWISSKGMIDGIKSVNRKATLEVQGRPFVVRGSFVGTQRGNLMVYSILNKKIDRQAGESLHKGLIAAVAIR